jgi:uncharacterized protein with beta-barrel porin domain
VNGAVPILNDHLKAIVTLNNEHCSGMIECQQPASSHSQQCVLGYHTTNKKVTRAASLTKHQRHISTCTVSSGQRRVSSRFASKTNASESRISNQMSGQSYPYPYPVPCHGNSIVMQSCINAVINSRTSLLSYWACLASARL